MAWRPNQNKKIADSPPPMTNSPAVEPNVENLPKETHSAKKVDVNRAKQVRRDTDKVENFSVTIEDIDTTLIEHLDKSIAPVIMSQGEQIKVPVIYGSPERWKSVQSDGYLRDAKGRLQLPLIMIKRSNVQRNDSLITFNRYLNMPFQRKYSPKNQYDRFTLLNNTNMPVHETYNVAMPDHVIVNYEVIVWTDTVTQNNSIIEKINWATEDYWGDNRRFKFRTSISDYSNTTEVSDGETRVVRSTFTLMSYAYLLPESTEDWRATTQKAFTPRKVVFNIHIEDDFDGNVYPKGDEEGVLEYKGITKKGGIDISPIELYCKQTTCITYKYNRFYGDNAPWNLSIYELKETFNLTDADLIHESSSARSVHITDYNKPNKGIDTLKSYAIYDIQKFDVGYYPVNITLWPSSSNIHQQMIPFNTDWTAPQQIDGQMIIYDSKTGFEYNLFGATFNTSSNTVEAKNGNLIKDQTGFPVNIYDYENEYSASRGAGIQYGAMAVRAEEIQSGSIHHALSMRITYPKADYVFPAVKLERTEAEITTYLGYARDLTPPPTVPHGARFMLNITDTQEAEWIDTLDSNINKIAAKTVVSALRDYGWFVTDTQNLERNSGSHAFDFEADESAGVYWNTIGFSGSAFRDMLDPLFTTSSVVAIKDLDYIITE